MKLGLQLFKEIQHFHGQAWAQYLLGNEKISKNELQRFRIFSRKFRQFK
jgi:hypothetical protein